MVIVSALSVPISRAALHRAAERLKPHLAALSYWSAILLPVIYLSLLLTRIHSEQKLVLFLSLVGLHILALIGGRSYGRTASR